MFPILPVSYNNSPDSRVSTFYITNREGNYGSFKGAGSYGSIFAGGQPNKCLQLSDWLADWLWWNYTIAVFARGSKDCWPWFQWYFWLQIFHSALSVLLLLKYINVLLHWSLALFFPPKHTYLLWLTHSHRSHKEEWSQGRYWNLGKMISRTEHSGLGSHHLYQRAVDEKRIICKCNITNHQAFSSIYIRKTYKCSAIFWCVQAFRLNGQTYQSITELLCMKWKYSAEFALFRIRIAYLMSSPPHKSLLHRRTGHQRTGRCRCNH